MILMLAVVVLLLIAGPLRRPFFSAWRFTVPATIGAVIGLVLGCLYIGFGAPWWMVIAGPLLFGFGLGSAGREWLDENIKPPRREG